MNVAHVAAVLCRQTAWMGRCETNPPAATLWGVSLQWWLRRIAMYSTSRTNSNPQLSFDAFLSMLAGVEGA